MKKKIAWLGVSGLVVAALVLTGCNVPVAEEARVGTGEEEVITLSIGETYQTPKVVVTVSEAMVTDSYEYYDEASGSIATKEASPGSYVFIITATIKNIANAPRMNEGPVRFVAFDSEGSKYEAEGSDFYEYGGGFGTETVLEDRLKYAASLLPGEEITGTVLFFITEGASILTVGYETDYPITILAEWEIE